MTQALLETRGLGKDYLLPRRRLTQPRPRISALIDVSLRLEPGRSLGIVGESGCGKSTLARIATALDSPSCGQLLFDGEDLFALSPAQLRRRRRHFQMVFQDPYGSLDPHHRVGRSIAEPLRSLESGAGAGEIRERVAAVLRQVGLKPGDAQRYPHEFSGGQRQRIAIARAIVTRPALVVADEAVSALDVSVQAQVLNLFLDLQQNHGLTYLFISHDLAVVRYIAQEVAVIYRGRVVERGPTAAVFAHPRHPYTKSLLEAVPLPDPARRRRGRKCQVQVLDNPLKLPKGCVYAARCAQARDACRSAIPQLLEGEPGRAVACHHPMT
ncbi:MAG: ATP-binding cassette domain-containing protein [Rhodospirillales bacterium]|nr:ATP-binding cassette domain-containing protein [Rhodospirillales bacterium]